MTVEFFAVVAPVVNYNFDFSTRRRTRRSFNLDLNILITMLKTELGIIAITDIMPSKYWFMHELIRAIFWYFRLLFFVCWISLRRSYLLLHFFDILLLFINSLLYWVCSWYICLWNRLRHFRIIGVVPLLRRLLLCWETRIKDAHQNGLLIILIGRFFLLIRNCDWNLD